MKNSLSKFIVVTLLSIFILNCSNSDDDNNEQSFLTDIEGTTWYRQETTTQSGQTIEIDFYLVFETFDTGYLEAETNSAGTNIIQTYDFIYVYSQGNGTAEFDDNNIGVQNFSVSGNQLTLDGETLTKL